jgi:tRNA(fMet)-specific endonuclease VapC
MVVVDTNIIIDHLRQRGKEDTVLMGLAQNIAKENLAISVVTVQELYEGKSTMEKDEEEYLLATLSPLAIFPYNYDVAQLAGEIARDLSRDIEFADAAIAATAIVNEASLASLNRKDFQDIKDLELFL